MAAGTAAAVARKAQRAKEIVLVNFILM